MTDWLLVVGCIFGINLLPAFGPPTRAVLVFFRLNSDLPAVQLTDAFFVGRLVSYSLYVAAASAAKDSLGTSSPTRSALRWVSRSRWSCSPALCCSCAWTGRG